MSLKRKLLLTTVLAALVPMGVTAAVAYSVARGALSDAAFARVVAVKDATARAVLGHFEYGSNRARDRAQQRATLTALCDFTEAYAALPRDLGWAADGAGAAAPLVDPEVAARAVQERVVEPLAAVLREGGATPASIPDLTPSTPSALALHYLFAAANPGSAEALRRIERPAGVATTYGEAHARHHGYFRPLVENFGYHDVLLVDAATRTVVYSVAKEIDLGADLGQGPLRTSVLGRVAGRALEAAEGEVVFGDFEPHRPSGGRVAAFLAAPVRDGRAVLGALVLQLSADEIDEVTATATGLGETGEVFLVGPDQRNRVRLRNDPAAPILGRNLASFAIQEALEGRSGTSEAADYRGVDTLVAYAPLDALGTRWALVSKLDAAEGYAPVRALLRWIGLLAAVLALGSALLAMLLARSLARPVQGVSERLQGLAGQMHSTSQEQQAGAAEQSAAVEETRQTFGGLLGATRDLSRIGTQVLENAEVSQRNAQAIGRRIEDLTASTATIGEVLGLVKDIANKSEILALNAALEGTKAGEAGRGFSLVATQMQRLAEQVMGSAKKIEGLTREIAKTSQGAVLAAEEAEKVAGRTTEAARQIASAVGLQQAGAEQVSTAMDEIAQVAQRNVESSRQTVSSANDLITLAESVRRTVGAKA